MQNSKETKIWNATLYLRLSRDDGDKEESNSITGQRELLRDFIRSRPELREYAVRIDDGFTGSNFDRPSFKKMLEDVKSRAYQLHHRKRSFSLWPKLSGCWRIHREDISLFSVRSLPSTTTTTVLEEKTLRTSLSFRLRIS